MKNNIFTRLAARYRMEGAVASDLPVAVLKMCIITGFVYVICLIIDFEALYGRFTLPIWLTVGNIDDSRTLLSAIIGSVSTVLALVFSVVLLVLSMAATQYGPRLLRRFILVQNGEITIGLFCATFLYGVLTLVIVRSENGYEFIPQLCNIFVVLLMIASFISLIIYCQDVRKAIQTGNMIAAVDSDLTQAISQYIEMRTEGMLQGTIAGSMNVEALRFRCLSEGYSIKAMNPGYLQYIDHTAIIEAVTAADAIVTITYRPGQFVFAHAVIAKVLPPEKGPGLESLIAQTVITGSNRTLTQDPEFAIAQIVEIGIRALSPAVNDTFTGVACIDWLCNDILSLVQLPYKDAWLDKAGQIRLIELSLDFQGFVNAAFNMIRQGGSSNPAILIRLLQNFTRMGPYLTTDAERAVILHQVEATYEQSKLIHLATFDHDAITKRYQEALQALQGV